MTASIRTSYHTHSHYCDGEGEIVEMIDAAIAAGLNEVGITSHAPLPFETDWTMPSEQLPQYAAEVRALQERYRDRITVLFGAEIDYIPGSEVDRFQREQLFPLGFDYFVGSVHFSASGTRRVPSTVRRKNIVKSWTRSTTATSRPWSRTTTAACRRCS